MKKIILLITLCSLFVSTPALHAESAYSASNWAEIATAALRGLLAGISYRNHGKPTAKAIHVATDVLRITNESLALSNAQNRRLKESDYSAFFWIYFDAANLAIDLFSKDQKTLDNPKLSKKQKEKINHLVTMMQTYLLPSIESLTSLYRAVSADDSQINCLHRQQAQALKSLTRALSVYLNHQKSNAAIVLLLGAIGEVMYVAKKTYAFDPLNDINNLDRDLWQNPEDDDFDPAYWQNVERNQPPVFTNQTPIVEPYQPAQWRPASIVEPAPAARNPFPPFTSETPVFRTPAPIVEPYQPAQWRPASIVEPAPAARNQFPSFTNETPIFRTPAPIFEPAQPTQWRSASIVEPAPAARNPFPPFTSETPIFRTPAPIFEPAQPTQWRPASIVEPAPAARNPFPPFTSETPIFRTLAQTPQTSQRFTSRAVDHDGLAQALRRAQDHQQQERAQEALERLRVQQAQTETRARQNQNRVAREREIQRAQQPQQPIHNHPQVQLVRSVTNNRNGTIGLEVMQNGHVVITPCTIALEDFKAGQHVRIAACGHATAVDEDDLLMAMNHGAVETCSQAGCNVPRARATEAVITIPAGVVYQADAPPISLDGDDTGLPRPNRSIYLDDSEEEDEEYSDDD